MRFAALAVFLAAPAAFAQTADTRDGQIRSRVETQALTRAAPTTSCYDATTPLGISIKDVRGYRVIVAAESGQTLSGAGNLRAYLWDVYEGAWMRNPSLDVAVTTTGARRQVFPDLATQVRTGCVMYAADAITVSGGTTVTVRIVASTEARP
jgi:hypothetical protein